MVTHLLESEGRYRHSFGAALPSIALHGALIFLAVHATANAALRRATNETTVDTLVFRAAPVVKRSADPIPTTRNSNAAPIARDAPIAIPTQSFPRISFTLDSMSKPSAPIVSHGDFRDGLSTGPSGPAIRGADGAAFDARSVDRQAEALPGTRPPAYPDALRASGMQGIVVAQFVVDTTGRVEPGSVQTTSSTNPLFSESVRSALIVARFRPAEVGGAPVRELVQQSFSFVLR
jgi:protein TonB